MPIFNDLNLDNWKESEIWTDSLWIIMEGWQSGLTRRLAQFKAEEWLSGRRRRTRNAVCSKGHREFESHLLRFVRDEFLPASRA